MNTAPLNADELEDLATGIESVLAEPASPRVTRSPWVDRLTVGATPTLSLRDLCELATEHNPAGPLATIQDLIAGLMLRHADDDVTTSALSAIAHYHLPNYVEGLRYDD